MAFTIKVATNEEAYALRSAMLVTAQENGRVTQGDIYKMLDLAVAADDKKTDLFWDYPMLFHIQIRALEDGWCVMLPQPNVPMGDNNESPRDATADETPTSDNYESEDDMVSHPPHYQSSNGIEVIDVIKAFTEGLTGIQATDTGNIIKYACRWHKKNGIQDLEKILWYTQHLINELKKEEIPHE